MAKWMNDLFADAAFDWLDQCDRMFVCSQQPANYTEASSTYCLATATMTPDTDYTKADGSPNGRKVTVAAKNGVTVTATGNATHIALGRSGDSTLRYVTTCTTKALTADDQVNIPAWAITIADPS